MALIRVTGVESHFDPVKPRRKGPIESRKGCVLRRDHSFQRPLWPAHRSCWIDLLWLVAFDSSAFRLRATSAIAFGALYRSSGSLHCGECRW
jgi:hypothetical protein